MMKLLYSSGDSWLIECECGNNFEQSIGSLLPDSAVWCKVCGKTTRFQDVEKFPNKEKDAKTDSK